MKDMGLNKQAITNQWKTAIQIKGKMLEIKAVRMTTALLRNSSIRPRSIPVLSLDNANTSEKNRTWNEMCIGGSVKDTNRDNKAKAIRRQSFHLNFHVTCR